MAGSRKKPLKRLGDERTAGYRIPNDETQEPPCDARSLLSSITATGVW